VADDSEADSLMARAELRPSPDALLAETRSAGRGRLKIFLGAAPGVGKTYEMLTQARQREADGVDVVIGVVETHGREETRRLTQNLAAVPPARLIYHGRQMQELDLDGLLKRKPQLALVDELAHTNVPGSRHEKRWQDVEELLAAGIDVYTTMNIQHLESLNDIVAKISRITVRETVPDHVLDRAEQIELVDLPPDDLIKRLHEGKVYVPETAEQALQHFFSPGNLTALRELVMRTAAQRVDADVLTWRRARAIEEPWPTQERLMVLIGNSADSARLVRLGRRLAGPGNTAWIVAHVSRVDGAAPRDDVTAALRLADELGAETVLLAGQDLVGEILDCATERNVTQIIVGRSRRRWRFLALQRSLATSLLRQARNIDITIAGAGDSVETRKWTRAGTGTSSHPGWKSYAEAAAATAGCAIIAWFLDPFLQTPNLGLVFLTGVLIAAVRTGLGPALFASALSFVVFNFFFTEPRHTFVVSSQADILTLSFFLLVAVVTGHLGARVRRQIETIRANNKRVASLGEFSRRMAGIVGRDDFSRVLIDYLRSTVALDAIVLFHDYASKLVVAAGDTRGGLADADQTAAEWAYDRHEAAGRGTGTLPNSSWLFIPLLGRKILGVLGVRTTDGRRTVGPEQERLLFAMRDQAGTALERVQLATAMEHTRLLTETDKLRAALLSSVSHDLRTPLVSIKGATTALLQLDATLAAADKRELLENILEETDRLNRYVQNLLDMTRLGYGAVTPQNQWRDVREIIGAARRALRAALNQRSVGVSIREGDQLIHTDAALLEQILVNLLENAAKYSPANTPIEIEGRRLKVDYELTVCDLGPGIPLEDRGKIFDLFRRARAADQQPAGTGMGLAICKGFAEALGGTIEVSGRSNALGACFRIRLPQPSQPPPIAEHTE
jgi:two-component system sensor histidine kinase KdpD